MQLHSHEPLRRHATRLRTPLRASPASPRRVQRSPLGGRAPCACGGACPHCRGEQHVEPTLTIGKADDHFEREADRVAAHVIHAPFASSGLDSDHEAENKLRRQATDHSPVESVPPVVRDELRSPGAPLDTATREFMEARFGYDFGHVRVHTGASAAESARAISAVAFTAGSHIVFGAGRYAPQTTHGRRLLAHELTHTVQQDSAGPPPAGSVGGIHTGARGVIQMVGECAGKTKANCRGSCVPASGRGTGFCTWSGTRKYGCVCVAADQPMLQAPPPWIVVPPATAYLLYKAYEAAAATGPRLALAGGGMLLEAGGAASAPAATAAGGATAAAEATAAGGTIAGGGAAAITAGALPVIAMVGVFMALGSGYAEARNIVRNREATSGFSHGFVMGLLGWQWSHVLNLFAKRFAIPTPADEAIGYIAANAYNAGLKAGYTAGADLSADQRKAYLREIRKLAGPRGSKTWTRVDQWSYVIELAAVAQLHFLKPE